MRKVCILTVYNSENVGSFLQAYALQETIKKQKCPVCFLKRNASGTSHSKKRLFKAILKAILSFDIKRAQSCWIRHFSFSRFQKHFEVVKQYSSNKQICLLIVGSDTLWNFADDHFWAKRYDYLARDIKGVDKITYAISAGNTSYKQFSSVEGIEEMLNDFKAFGVRDLYTDSLIGQISNRDTQMVCDPAFLLSQDDYNLIAAYSKQMPEKYILLYFFGNLSQDLRAQIKEFAKSRNLQIIRIGLDGSDNWCKTILSTPDFFLQYMRNADYVITNTFHGTVFSIIFRREFVSYTSDKKKVIDLLQQLNLKERLVGNPESIQAVLGTQVDYQKCEAELDSIIHTSKKFLFQHLEASYEI